MNVTLRRLLAPAGCALVLFFVRPVHAQDTVTVPKSRLEELERKERELDRLKGDVSKTKAENEELKEKLQQMPTNQVTAPAPPHPVPALATLPPLQPGDVIDSKDLAAYYRQEPAAANQRFRNQRLTVTGEIVGFEKPLLKRNYHVLLPGTEPTAKVICDFYPPDKYNAVLVANHGAELVGLIGETKVPLAKVGEHVLIKGLCKGGRESEVTISAGELTQAPAPGK
jgi:hypothetical protein